MADFRQPRMEWMPIHKSTGEAERRVSSSIEDLEEKVSLLEVDPDRVHSRRFRKIPGNLKQLHPTHKPRRKGIVAVEECHQG